MASWSSHVGCAPSLLVLCNICFWHEINFLSLQACCVTLLTIHFVSHIPLDQHPLPPVHRQQLLHQIRSQWQPLVCHVVLSKCSWEELSKEQYASASLVPMYTIGYRTSYLATSKKSSQYSYRDSHWRERIKDEKETEFQCLQKANARSAVVRYLYNIFRFVDPIPPHTMLHHPEHEEHFHSDITGM